MAAACNQKVVLYNRVDIGTEEFGVLSQNDSC